MTLLRMIFSRSEFGGCARRNFFSWISRKSAFMKPFSTFWSRFEFDRRKSRVAISGDFSFSGEFDLEVNFRGLSFGGDRADSDQRPVGDWALLGVDGFFPIGEWVWMGWNIDPAQIGYGIGVWPSRSSAMLPSNTMSKSFVSSSAGFTLDSVLHLTIVKGFPRATLLVRFWDLSRVRFLARPGEVLSIRVREVFWYLGLSLGLPLEREFPEPAVFLGVKYCLLGVWSLSS
jgi:hypothetical protein